MNHKYEYGVDPKDDDTAAAKVVRYVGKQKRVLEIGSGPGSITRVLHEHNGCLMTAIEIDDEAIKMVSGFCEAVVKCDLNSASWTNSFKDKPGFDVVVAADVLEHLYDPWAVLSQIKEVVAPGGAVVISLPHAGHNSVVACLLNGDVEYRKIGLLDKTHIRFFALKNVQQLFEAAGYAIVDASFVGRHASQTELKHQWAALSSATRRVLDKNPYGCIYQIVLKAVPANGSAQSIQLTNLPLPDLRPTLTGRIKDAVRRRLDARRATGS